MKTSFLAAAAVAVLALIALVVVWISLRESPPAPDVALAQDSADAPPARPEPVEARRSVNEIPWNERDVAAPIPDGVPVRVIPAQGKSLPDTLSVAYLEELTLASADLEAALDGHGRNFACDRDGRTTVPRPRLAALVACLAGGDLGVAAVRPDSDEVQLELQPDSRVTVRVRDRRGDPQGNLPVALRLMLGAAPLDLLTRTTDRDGIAVLRHLARYATPGADGAATNAYQVGLSLPLAPPVAQAVDLLDPPQGPIDLTLPDTGAVSVELFEADASPCTGDGEVELLAVAVVPGSPHSLDAGARRFTRPLDDGRARFPHVGLGLQILVSAHVPGRDERLARFSGRGPGQPGEVVEVRLGFAAADVTYTGLLRDADGQPLGNVELDYTLRAPDAHDAELDTGALRTDASGRFRLPVEGSLRTFARRLILVSRDPEHPGRAEHDVDRGGQGDELDLGDVTLR